MTITDQAPDAISKAIVFNSTKYLAILEPNHDRGIWTIILELPERIEQLPEVLDQAKRENAPVMLLTADVTVGQMYLRHILRDLPDHHPRQYYLEPYKHPFDQQ